MIPQLRLIAGGLLVLLSLLQALFFPEGKNLACLAIILVASGISGCLLFRREAFATAPLSSMIALAYATTSLLVPLLGVTLDWRPLTHNLWLPVETFRNTALTVVIAAGTHWLYRRMKLARKVREYIADHALSRLGLFKPLSTAQLWTMGAAGCLAIGSSVFLFSSKSNVAGFLPQLIGGFQPFACAPLLILVARYFWKAPKPSSSQWVALVGYMAVIAFLALAVNARGKMAIPLATAATVALLAMMMDRLRFRIFQMKIVIPVLLIGLVVMPILGDLAFAMRAVRGQRGKVSGTEMVVKSFSALFNREQLANYQSQMLHSVMGADEWDERYLDNEFLQRLTLVKYTDNALYYTRNFSPQDQKRLVDFANGRLVGILPTPVLRLLGIYTSKWAVLNMSIGDFIFYARTGFQYAGFRTGSFIGTDLVLYGGLFWIVFAGMALFAFWLFDCFSRRIEVMTAKGRVNYYLISPFILVNFYTFLLVFNIESSVTLASIFVRQIPQLIFLYLLLRLSTSVFNWFTVTDGSIALKTRSWRGPTRPPQLPPA